MTPSSGSGVARTFQFLYRDPNGYQEMGWVFGMINSVLRQDGACYFQYNRGPNTLWLRNDACTAWVGPVTLGSPGTIANSQCSVNLSGSSASGSGEDLAVTLQITFQAGFSGTKRVYQYAADTTGLNSGWWLTGSWNP